jgi:uncharacterized protein (TIGR03435 family)
MKTALLLGLSLALAPAPAHSQTPASPAPPTAFEVASVRIVSPHSIEDQLKGIGAFSVCTYPTNRFFVHYVPLRIVISMAFDGTSGHVLGPDWLDSQLYSIDANVDGDTKLSQEEMKPLLRKLLEERFHLRVHTETKTAPGFALTVTNSGPKLDPGKPRKRSGGEWFPDRILMWHVPVSSFAESLSSPAGGPVVDRTGITGTYYFDLRFAPANDPSSNLPSLFTALQQLGLKLVSQKVPVDYLVIDHVDRTPTEN